MSFNLYIDWHGTQPKNSLNLQKLCIFLRDANYFHNLYINNISEPCTHIKLNIEANK